jgi:hypothetical protein
MANAPIASTPTNCPKNTVSTKLYRAFTIIPIIAGTDSLFNSFPIFSSPSALLFLFIDVHPFSKIIRITYNFIRYSFKKFDLDILKKNLSKKYEQLSNNLYYKCVKSDFLISLFANEPKLKEYGVMFYKYEDSNKEMISRLPKALYKILVVHEHNFPTIKHLLSNYEEIFSGIIVYNSNGIVKMRYSYLETFSKNDNFDYYSKFVFRRLNKNYKVLLNQETTKLIWRINKKLL